MFYETVKLIRNRYGTLKEKYKNGKQIKHLNYSLFMFYILQLLSDEVNGLMMHVS